MTFSPDTRRDEDVRLSALARLDILDTPPELEFDDIAQLAADLLAAPVALVSLVDRDRQWFKARVGFEACETPIDRSVCAFTLRQTEILVIPDLTLDPRTAGNPLVTGPPHARFYAGAPLRTADGTGIGALCVLDTAPRPEGVSAAQARGLEGLARQVVRLLEMRTSIIASRAAYAFQASADATTLARSAATLARSEASGERAIAAQEAGRIGTVEVDVAAQVVAVSAEACRIFGLPVMPSYPAATFERAVLPADRVDRSSNRSRTDGTAALDTEYRIRRASDGAVRWIARRARFERDEAGTVVRMVGTVQDVTEEKLVAARLRALVDFGDDLREATSVAEVIAAAGELLGHTLGANRAGYSVVDRQAGTFTVERDWTAPEAASLAGQHATGHVEATLRRLATGSTLRVSDVEATDWLAEDRAAYAAMGIRSEVQVPLLVGGELVGVLFVHDALPREWSDAEVAFVQGVADRTYAAVAKLRAEVEQEVLNRELAHRVKNSLAMVAAIVRQTLRDLPEGEVATALNRRIQALGRSHDILIQRGWSGGSLEEVARATLHAIAQEARVERTGPPVLLGPRAVPTTSLILHELATNAMKYGALSNPEGRVALTWGVEGEGDDRLLVLSWVETGGPPVMAPRQRGMGSRLIQAGLLGTGGASIEYRTDGVRAEFRAPMRRVTAA